MKQSAPEPHYKQSLQDRPMKYRMTLKNGSNGSHENFDGTRVLLKGAYKGTVREDPTHYDELPLPRKLHQ